RCGPGRARIARGRAVDGDVCGLGGVRRRERELLVERRWLDDERGGLPGEQDALRGAALGRPDVEPEIGRSEAAVVGGLLAARQRRFVARDPFGRPDARLERARLVAEAAVLTALAVAEAIPAGDVGDVERGVGGFLRVGPD